MSNLRNPTRLPMRSTIANKSKSHTSANDLPERKTQALEGSSNKSKLTTQREKAKTTMEVYRRTKLTSEYPRDQPAERKQLIKCGQCETQEAKMKCIECVEVYCTSCYSQFHLRGALQRHHGVLLPIFPKKTSTEHIEMNVQQTDVIDPLEEITNDDQDDIRVFQEKFLQWREESTNKPKRTQQKRGLTSSTIQKLPSIDSNSSKINSDETILPNEYRSSHQEISQQPLTKTNHTKKNHSKAIARIHVHNSSLNQTGLFDLQPSTDVLSMIQLPENIDVPSVEETSTHPNILLLNDEQERSITKTSIKSLSRSRSPSGKKDPNVLLEEPLRSTLATKSTDQLEAIISLPLVFSRPSSAHSEKFAQQRKSPINSILASNEQPSTNNPVTQNTESVIAQSDTILQDSSDSNKPKFPYPINRVDNSAEINFVNTTPGRDSPFSFSNPLCKIDRMNSASSIDADERGFFTDIPPRRITTRSPLLISLPLLECPTFNECRHRLDNHITQSNHIILPKLSIPSLSRPPSKPMVPPQGEIEHRPKTPIDNESRPGSSLSSASLSLSITSSKSGFNPTKGDSSTTASRKSSSSTVNNTTSSTATTKESSSSTAKDSSTTKESSSSTTKESSSSTTKESSSSAAEDSSTATKESGSLTTEDSSTKTKESPLLTAKDSSTTTKESAPSATTTKTSTEPTSTSKDPSSINSTTAITTATTTTAENSIESIKEDASSEKEPMTIKEEQAPPKLDPNQPFEESVQSSKEKDSSDDQPLETTDKSIELVPSERLIRETNITEKDLSTRKKSHHRIRRRHTADNEPSQLRKLEFSIGDGLKWQEASLESMSSTDTIVAQQSPISPTSPPTLSPSNLPNTTSKPVEQFYQCDNGNDQSSGDYQNLNDQHCDEFSSQLNIQSSDEDALLNDQLLKILQNNRNPFIEKELPLLESKLREMELPLQD